MGGVVCPVRMWGCVRLDAITSTESHPRAFAYFSPRRLPLPPLLCAQILVGPWVWSKLKASNHRALACCQALRARALRQRLSKVEDALSRGGRHRRSSIVVRLAASVTQLEAQVRQ
jgi:hypothetical protein